MRTKKILMYLLLFLGVTTLTSIIANKTEGFSKNPFKEEIKDVNTDNENLLTFYIEGIEFKFEEGMTWGEWVQSDYNHEFDVPHYDFTKINLYVDGDYISGDGYESVNFVTFYPYCIDCDQETVDSLILPMDYTLHLI